MFASLLFAFAAFWFFLPAPLHALTGPALIKGSTAAVYYLATDARRYVFLNSAVFATWYPSGSRPTILTVSDQALAQIPWGGVVPHKPGARLVKIQSDPKVYAVAAKGVLHWILNEQVARALYGQAWNTFVDDWPASFFALYQQGASISSATDFNPAELRANARLEDQLTLAAATTDGWFTPTQKRRAEQLVNLFEYSTIDNQYGAIEDIHDGRGYTAGRIGFTTATGDAYDVVVLYTNKKPSNPLAPFLARLAQLKNNEDPSTNALGGFVAAWKQSANDPLFRQAQDKIMDEVYYRPAMQVADRLGLTTPLARAIIFDTIVQHGESDENPDGLPAMLRETTSEARGTPATGYDEKSWIRLFLRIRRQHLIAPADAATREAWSASAGRVDVLSSLIDQNNWQLNGPIIVTDPDYAGRIE